MIEAIVGWAVGRRKLVLVLTLIAALVAAFVCTRLRFDALPDVTTNQVLVLTAAQGLLGVAFLANGRLRRWEAVALLLLFLVQLPFSGTSVRYWLSGGYLALSLLMLVRDRAFLMGHLRTTFSRGGQESAGG